MLKVNKHFLKKRNLVEDIQRKIVESSSIVFYDFSFTKTNEIFRLKKKLREIRCSFSIFKNTFFKIALKNTLKIEINEEILKGNNAFVFCNNDQYSALKVLKDFSFREENENRFRGGIYNNSLVSKEKLQEWSKLPSREFLIIEFCDLLMFELFRLVSFIKEIEKQKFNEGIDIMKSGIDKEKIDLIVNTIKDLSSVSLKALNDRIKEENGIDSSAILQKSSSQEVSSEDQKESSSYSLILNSIGSQKMQVYKMLKEMMESGISIIEVKKRADNIPYTISDKIDQEKANTWKSQLESVGAVLEMKKN